jgi:hypothetical protein
MHFGLKFVHKMEKRNERYVCENIKESEEKKMNNFVELTFDEMSCINGGRSWDTAGEYMSGLGGATIGGAVGGPPGAFIGAVVGFAGYWLMED